MSDLRTFLRGLESDDEREVFASKCGTTAGHLRNVSYGERRAAPELCVELERHTDGAVTCEELRPDLPWSRSSDRKWPHSKGRPVLDFARVA